MVTTQASVESKAREALKLLAELQDIDDELKDIAGERGDLPEEVEALKLSISELEAFLQERRNELSATEAELVRRSHQLAEAKEKLTKHQQQLYAVKTTREYDAITAEFNFEKEEISTCERVIGQQTARQIELTRIIGERTKELESARAEELVKRSELDAKLAESAGDVKLLMDKRTGVVNSLNKPIYAHYERMRIAKDNRGVARLLDGACGGCFAVIPPQRQQNIRAQLDIIICETCGRYIVP